MTRTRRLTRDPGFAESHTPLPRAEPAAGPPPAAACARRNVPQITAETAIFYLIGISSAMEYFSR
jgi:hypothetical protein